jgi:hypothetical protein
MAQLNGVMTADFSDFAFEVDKSVVKLKELEGASGHTSGAIDDFSQGLSAADKTLGLFGVNIGPQIRALKELTGILGQNVTQMGLWQVAGAGAAAAMAGWQIGTMISDWGGLEEKIANATAAALGFGDVATERLGAKMDVLSRASQLAGRAITDFDQALQIIKTHNAEVAESFNTGTARVEQWTREIAAARSAGHLPAITQDLKNHTSTVQELSTHYGISVRALEYYTRTLDASAKAQKAWADEARPKYEAIRKAQEELNQAGDGWRRTLETIAPATAAAVTQHLALGQSQTTIATAYSLSAVQVQALDKAYREQIVTLASLEPATQSLDTWIRTAGQQFVVAAESGDQFKTMLELTGGAVDTLVPKVEKLETTFRSVTEAARVSPVGGGGAQMGTSAQGSVPINLGNISFGPLGMEAIFAQYAKTAGGGGGALGGFVGGGPPKDFITWALQMGLASRGPTVNNTFNIVDTQDGIAKKVGDTITAQVQRGSLVT